MSDDVNRNVIGARLKEAREYRGFSQEDVAKFLGISRSAISLIESGERGLDILELTKLAKLYECTIESITGKANTKESEPDSVKMVARAAAALSDEDRSEILKFAQYLQARKTGKKK